MPIERRPGSQVTITQLIALAAWLGAAVSLAAVVAPATFAVLPNRSLAGLVIGRVLPAIFVSGCLVGVGVAAAVMVAGGGWQRLAAGLALALSCGGAQWVVSPLLERVRREGAPLETLAPADARRLRFGRLHAISVACLALGGVAGVVALAYTARDVRPVHTPV
ncbi:MAG: hypothetical protein NVS1B4_13090 [Gemmatimonadaceae bacterium]